MGINYDSALGKAKEYWGQIDYVREYDDAFVFSKKGDESFGGHGPVVVMKGDGKVINYVAYITSSSAALVGEGDAESYGAS